MSNCSLIPPSRCLDIAVPPNVLLDLIREACARGTVKGILAQKPLGMNYAEAWEAVKLCEAAYITLAVNQNMRYDHSVRAAMTLLKNGTDRRSGDCDSLTCAAFRIGNHGRRNSAG